MSNSTAYTLEELQWLTEGLKKADIGVDAGTGHSFQMAKEENILPTEYPINSDNVEKLLPVEKQEMQINQVCANEEADRFTTELEEALKKYPVNLQVKHIAEFLGIGRTMAYNIIKKENIPRLLLKESNKIIIPKRKFMEWYIEKIE